MVLIKSFFTGALYDRSRLAYGYLIKGDEVRECCSCLKLMIQAYLYAVVFFKKILFYKTCFTYTILLIYKTVAVKHSF